MEDSLKCAFCNFYAQNAMESNCQCALIYCEQCTHKVEQCQICNCKLTAYDLQQRIQFDVDQNDENKISFGFSENKLARRLINQIQIKCSSSNCNYEGLLIEMKQHVLVCEQREHQCSICGHVFPNKTQFIEHVNSNHWLQFLKVFDGHYLKLSDQEKSNKNSNQNAQYFQQSNFFAHLQLLEESVNQPQEDFGRNYLSYQNYNFGDDIRKNEQQRDSGGSREIENNFLNQHLQIHQQQLERRSLGNNLRFEQVNDSRQSQGGSSNNSSANKVLERSNLKNQRNSLNSCMMRNYEQINQNSQVQSSNINTLEERKQHIFGYHKSHSEEIKNIDCDQLNEVLIQEEEGKIEGLKIQDDQVNQSIEPADDLVEQPKLNKSVSMFSPRDQKWQCFKCNMINTLQNSRCIRCKGEFMKNFLQIKDDVKNFIERIRKEQLKEQQKLHRESQEKLRKSQIAQSGGGGNANKHKDSDECRIF